VTRLCVPIVVEGLAGVGDALEAGADGAEFGADLIEWRIDPLAAEPDLDAAARAVGRLLRESPRPVILTCRDPDEGGAAEIDDEDRAALLEAIADRTTDPPPRFVDLELATWRRSPRLRDAARRLLGRPTGDEGGRGAAANAHPGLAVDRGDDPRLILSSHAFAGRPADLWSTVAEIAAVPDADVIKVAWTARSLRDVAEVAELLADRPRPMIALVMGPFGLASRVLAGRFGGLLSFASLGEARATAPGQPTLAAMRDLYRVRSIGRRTRVYGVIGMPVDHSLGPRLHNAGFDAVSEDAVYLPMPVAEGWESFKATVAVLLDTPAMGFAGASVTIPHKEHALRFVRDRGGTIDPLADLAGAANTLIVEPGGGLRAMNTDAPAVVDALATKLPDGVAIAGRRIVILGAGGAARAAAAALAAAGAAITIVGRTAARVDALCADLHEKPRPDGGGRLHVVAGRAEDLAADAFDVVLQATPVGMATGPDAEGDPLPAPVALGPQHVVFETVYAPLETPLVRRARAAGCRIVTGDAMFERQAARQFEAWTGRPLPEAAWASIRPR
jgi:3-dehydroquinate dehydratase/shikimate dehydrogenase